MTSNNKERFTIFPQLILLSTAQLFNHWMDRSFKIFAVFIHADLGITLSTLSYILTFGAYGPVIVLITSPFYHHFPSNVILTALELTGTIAMALTYFYGYQIVWLLFICRLAFSSSIKGIFTYTNTMIAHYVPNKQNITKYLSIFDSAFVASTFLFVFTGFILNRHHGFFQYLLLYSIISSSFAIILFALMPKSKTSVSDISEKSLCAKINNLLSNNTRYVLLLSIVFFEQISQSIFNITIGVFVKQNYNANALKLGLYTTLTQGIAQLIGIGCIAFIFGKCIKQKYFVLIAALFEFIVYVIFFILIWNEQRIYIETCLLFMFIISLGHFGLYYGLVIVLIRAIPSHEQAVGSAVWSIIDILGGSCGTFTVGRIAQFYVNDVYLYSAILLIVYFCCMLSVGIWCCKSNDNFTTSTSGDGASLMITKHPRYHSVSVNSVEFERIERIISSQTKKF